MLPLPFGFLLPAGGIRDRALSERERELKMYGLRLINNNYVANGTGKVGDVGVWRASFSEFHGFLMRLNKKLKFDVAW